MATIQGKIVFKLLSSDMIMRQFAKDVNAAALRAKPRIESRVKELIGPAIRSSPEAGSLVSGQLRGELGLIDGKSAIEAIISSLTDGVVVTVSPIRTSSAGEIRVEVLKADMSESLGIPGASFQSKKSFDIDWLDWLLTKGTQRVLITNHHYVMNAKTREFSRTGMGIMQKGGSWGVPATFAGTVEDNWLTRALKGLDEKAGQIMIEEFERAL